MKQELRLLTEELVQWNDRMLQVFEERAEKVYDFEKDVKPFVQALDEIVEPWRELAEKWVRTDRPKYMHPILIVQTYENIQQASVTCFVATTKQKRFYETHRAIAYVLQNILQ